MNETEALFFLACDAVGLRGPEHKALLAFLAPLRDKSAVTHVHYLHSLRVGMLARKIGAFIHHEERPLLLAGALHDLGKCQVCLDILGKTEDWSVRDQKEIKRHVTDGYRMLRGRFDFTAETMVRHHSFQHDGYPKRLPGYLHPYSESTKLLIGEYARIVALADVYDALHRANDKFGEKRALSEDEVRALMFDLNPDRKKLLSALFKHNVFAIEHIATFA